MDYDEVVGEKIKIQIKNEAVMTPSCIFHN